VIPSSLRNVTLSLLFLLAPFAAYPQQTASDLVAQAVKNEEADNKTPDHISFLSHERSTRTAGHLWIERVVKTQDGDLRRLVSIDGLPIPPAKAKVEDERLASIVAHPGAFRRKNQNDDLLPTIPRMFLFAYDGRDGSCAKVHFKPNPAFTPANYEQRVVHALEGTILIKQPENRLCGVDARIAQPVQFGLGVFGRVEPGGTIHINLVQTTWGQWVTSELHVHVAGKVLLLKNLSKDEDNTRTDFAELPANLTLAQAADATRR
jgi:hypothetical protein